MSKLGKEIREHLEMTEEEYDRLFEKGTKELIETFLNESPRHSVEDIKSYCEAEGIDFEEIRGSSKKNKHTSKKLKRLEEYGKMDVVFLSSRLGNNTRLQYYLPIEKCREIMQKDYTYIEFANTIEDILEEHPFDEEQEDYLREHEGVVEEFCLKIVPDA